MLAGTRCRAAHYERLHKLIGEGNFVLAMCEGSASEGYAAPKRTAHYDLYRLAEGIIVEHWEVVEPIPSRDKWRNNNGKF